MEAELQEAMARLLSAHRQGFRLALLFDYDGTLTPIVEHPELARLEPQTRRLLQHFARRPGISVGIISGRGLDDLWGMVGLSGLYYAGNSGLEMDLLGKRVTHPEVREYRGLLQRVVRRLGELTAVFPGAWVEDKQVGLSLHYRQVALHQREGLLGRAGQEIGPYARHLRVVQGPMAWEISPELSWDKGSALRLILESIGPDVFPVYAGDGANDAGAMETTVTLGGVALGIGADAPAAAQYRFLGQAAFVTFLSSLADALAASCTALA
jgi:trehalose 6-phosphate phosphatase